MASPPPPPPPWAYDGSSSDDGSGFVAPPPPAAQHQFSDDMSLTATMNMAKLPAAQIRGIDDAFLANVDEKDDSSAADLDSVSVSSNSRTRRKKKKKKKKKMVTRRSSGSIRRNFASKKSESVPAIMMHLRQVPLAHSRAKSASRIPRKRVPKPRPKSAKKIAKKTRSPTYASPKSSDWADADDTDHSSSDDDKKSDISSSSGRKKKKKLLPITKQKDVLKKWQKIREELSTANSAWEKHVQAFQDLAGMLDQGDILRLSKARWKKELRITTVVVLEQLRSLRSNLFKEACAFVSLFASKVGRRRSFDESLQLMLPVLMSRHYVTVVVIRENSKQCVHDLLKHTNYMEAFDLIVEIAVSDSHKQVREKCSDYIRQILTQAFESGSMSKLDREMMSKIRQVVSTNIKHSDPKTRQSTQDLFKALQDVYGVTEKDVFPKARSTYGRRGKSKSRSKFKRRTL